MNTLLRNAGGGLGTQMSTSLIGATISPATGLASDTGFTTAFLAGGLACLAGLVVASWIPNFGRDSRAVERRLPPTSQPDIGEEPA